MHVIILIGYNYIIQLVLAMSNIKYTKLQWYIKTTHLTLIILGESYMKPVVWF